MESGHQSVGESIKRYDTTQSLFFPGGERVLEKLISLIEMSPLGFISYEKAPRLITIVRSPKDFP